MNPWYIALVPPAVISVAWILYRLHRWLLLLEERGQIYYLHKRPQSGAVSCLGALQEVIEPGYKNVAQIGNEQRADSRRREQMLQRLLAELRHECIDSETLRRLLRLADEEGVDAQGLYEEAVCRATELLGRAAQLPAWSELAPPA